jgi:hypothetical protein
MGGQKKKLCCNRKSHDFKAITASNKFGGDKKNCMRFVWREKIRPAVNNKWSCLWWNGIQSSYKLPDCSSGGRCGVVRPIQVLIMHHCNRGFS